MPLGHLIALISNAHRDRSADRCLGETQLLQMTIRLGAHCTERPEVIQDKPNPDLRLRADLKILHANRHKQLTLLEYADVYVSAQEYPLFTMSIARALRRRATIPSQARNGKDCSHSHGFGGAGRDRTDDLKLAKLPLSQLSYGPDPIGAYSYGSIIPEPNTTDVVGLGRFELPTSRLSSARSNQLSYRPDSRVSMRRKRNVGGGFPR
ncbi:protein of unknown function [Hyphomicrobium sp. 1Nfss2.1]